MLKTLFAAFFFLLAGTVSGLQVNVQTTFVASPGATGTTIQDVEYLPLPSTPGFVNYKVANYVKVAINHQFISTIPAAFNYNLNLEIKYRDNNKTLFTITELMNVQYNPAAGVAYKDYSTYNFSGAHEMTVKVLGITDAVSGLTVIPAAGNIDISYGINIERYRNFISTGTSCVSKAASDLNGDGEMDELTLTWLPISGAEDYELEWTYVDDYTSGSVASTVPASSIVYDFKYNSTRISTKNLSYKVNLVYERGYVIFRLRGVGRKLTNISTVINGDWSVPDMGTGLTSLSCGSSTYYYSTGHRSLFNWQYSSTFAEEGKKKEVVGYYDGGLRNRQTVTKVNTTDTAIVGESFYDFQGRKAIDALPVPAQSPALTYYPDFNKNLGLSKYSREDFDKDVSGQPCTVNSGQMSPGSGSSRYYSSSNTNVNTMHSYLPNALNYPYSQVEYTPDNTGRIRRMGGVGNTHQLGTGKETKYYYGRPLQEELDRLFGSEVGFDRHYKKNVVVDPNGQVSISYLDQEGHVIATALSGDKPGNVSAINSQINASANLSVDFFSKKTDGSSLLNALNIDQTALIFNTQYLVSTPGQTHVFNYNLTPMTLTDPCLTGSICFDCVYDMELQVRDECGVLKYSNVVRIGSLTLNNVCGGIEYVPSGNAPAPFSISNMAVGNYQISKVLTVNKAAYDYYLGQFLNATNNTCFKSYETILTEEQAAMVSVKCNEDCSECLESLGTADNFVLTGKGTYEEYIIAYNGCMEDCKNPSICEQTYESMLADMMPGGQYAEWYDSLEQTGFNANKFPLSILNAGPQLPDATASWKTPQYLRKNASTVTGYFEADGIRRSRIPVIPVTGGFFPPTTATFQDANLIYYTYPENLVNVRDFVTYWQESWARSLVVYHPEYCYYKWCLPNTMDTVGTATMSSEDFDNKLQAVTSYATAVSNGWITGSDNVLLSLDPYFSTVTDGVAQVVDMSGQIGNYLGSGMSMKKMAALTVKCPGYFGSLSGVTATCTTFVASGTTATDDAMWAQYKAFYFSAKQKLIRIAADNYAINTTGLNCGKGYNGCIGKDNFNPYGSALVRFSSISPFANINQPCNWKNYLLYKDKTPRFTLGAEILENADQEKAQFNAYYHTGLCPAESDLAFWMHSIASSGKLMTSFQLQTSVGFTQLLYNSIIAPTAPTTTYTNYSWTPVIDPLDAKNLNISFTGSGTSICVLRLKMPLPGYLWSRVRDFTNIKVGIYNSVTNTTGFTINALIDDDGVPGTPNITVKITGNSCVRLGDCKFYDQCRVTDFGTRLFSLMGVLANQTTSQLVNTAFVPLETPPYQVYLSRYLRNTLGSTLNTNLRWVRTLPTTAATFELSDLSSTGTAQNVKVTFSTFTPAFPLSDLYKIKYFTDVKTDDANVSNGFVVTAWYEVSPGVMQSVVIRGTISRGVMASCAAPVPIECQTKENQAGLDLQKLISKWLTQPLSAYNLHTDNDYTELLSSYIGVVDQETRLENISKDATGFKASIRAYKAGSILYNSCDLNLYHINPDYTGDFSTIVSVGPLKADYSKQKGSNTYYFKMEVTYASGEIELIGGYTTCIPVRSCGCETDKLQITYSNCSDRARITIDAIKKYNANKYGNNPNGLSVPLITESEYDCNCGEGYLSYLAAHASATTPPWSFKQFIINTCRSLTLACPEYISYYNTLTDFNRLHPANELIIAPVSGFPCTCVTEYVNYIKTFNFGPSLYTLPAMSLSTFIANGCVPPKLTGEGPSPSGCGAAGWPALDAALQHAVNQYNSSLTPPGSLVSPSYNPAVDCECYKKYKSYLAGNAPKFPKPAKTFAEFQAQGCVDLDCWGAYYFMAAQINSWALYRGLPAYEPPPYDRSLCACYYGYIDYAKAHYGVNMLSISEYCAHQDEYPYDDGEGEGLVIDGDPLLLEEVSYALAVPNTRNLDYRTRCDDMDTLIAQFQTLPDPCELFKSNQAIYNAKKRYEDQVLNMTTEFRNKYYTKCLSLTENFTGTVPTRDYHYTLYYYDQAGNLVSTVPPEGVKLIDLSVEGTRIKDDREKGRQSVYNEHFLKTTYEYNSLNQLRRQSVPDNDKMDVWQVDNSNGIPSVVTITDIQFLDGNIGYSTGQDASGWGYIYKTTDGGLNWKRLDPKSADINKVRMFDANNGFAVGNDGLFLQTLDGGRNWVVQVVNITTTPAPITGVVTENLNDLAIFYDMSMVLIVGNGGTVVKANISGGTSMTFNNLAGTALINSTMNMTSVCPDQFGGTSMNKAYITVHIPSASSNAYRVFTNNLAWSSSTGWTDNAINTKLKAADLKAVYLYDANNGYAAGVNGTLLKTSDGGVNWVHVATNTITNFTKLYFLNANNGIALGSNGFLYTTTTAGTAWKQASALGFYNDINFYDVASGKGYAVGNKGSIAFIDAALIGAGKAVKKLINTVTLNEDLGAVAAMSITEVFVGSSAGTAYKMEKTGDDKVKFTSIATSSAGQFKAARFTTTSKGAFLNTSGKLYKCIAVSGVYTLTAIATGSTYGDITMTAAGDLYGVNMTTTSEIHKSDAAWSTMLIQGLAYTGSEVAVGLYLKPTTDILAVGASGAILNFQISGSTWTSNSQKTAPLMLRDVYAVPTSAGSTTNTAYIAGDDGTVIRTTDGGASWQTLNTGTAAQLNSLVFANTTDGIIVGNGGTTLRSISSGITAINSGTTKDLKDICYNASATRYSMAGQDRTVLQSINGGLSYTKLIVPGNPADMLNGISDVSTTLCVMGTDGNAGSSLSGTWQTCYKQPSALTAVHINKTSGLGMMVGKKSSNLYTTDKGYTWRLNKPIKKTTTTLYDMTGVAVHASNSIYVTALSSLPFMLNDLQANLAFTNLTGTASANWNDVQIGERGIGYMCGDSRRHGKFIAGTTAYTAGTTSGLTAGLNLNSVSISDKQAFVAGVNKTFFVVDDITVVSPTISIKTLPGTVSASAVLQRYEAYDRLNGIILGTGGVMIRVWDENGSMSFEDKSTQNNNGTAVTSSLQAVAYSSRNRVVFGGASGHIKNLETEKQYTSLFWYDRLGRMVVSQNTKQYKKATKAYSYTLYDALGRITQVGEIAQGALFNNQYQNRQLDDALFSSWISGGTRTEVTQTYYDEQFPSTGPLLQINMRKRVASVTYEDVYDNNNSTYQSATHYTYDIHGNVNRMAQEIREAKLLATGLNIKYINYDYDLISGKVNKVSYNVGQKDQYYHKYEYDGDNRITHTYTSRDDIWYDNDARYKYYNYGALGRTELGDLNVQGTDYAYTLQGWIKGANSGTLQTDRDMGRDGNIGGTRQYTARDAAGYTLGYYNNDYQSIKGYTTTQKFEADMTGKDLENARNNLYNGNIGSMVSAMPEVASYNSTRTIIPSIRGCAYKYDQLNRLMEARSFFNIGIAGNQWNTGTPTPMDYYENFTYDAMGNIQHVNRYGNGGLQMDNMDYKYETNGSGNLVSNMLYHVNDPISSSNFSDDIDGQGTFVATPGLYNYKNNYSYDELGNLRKDSAEGIKNIKWTVYGKVKEVTRYPSSTKPDLEFVYDAMGNRIVKIVKPKPLNCATYKYYYYLRDASGNEMANYELNNTGACGIDKLYVTAHPIYGSSRLGVDMRKTLLYNGVNVSNDTLTRTNRTLSLKQYELSNHLGNVLVTITDKKTPKRVAGSGPIDYFDPEIATISDYYAFGTPMPTRNWSDPNLKYKYGFNGKEKDNEINVDGGSYDFGARIYDSRLGRFLSVDPRILEFPWQTSYCFADNKPILFIDIDGEGTGVPATVNLILVDPTATLKLLDSRALAIVSRGILDATANANSLGLYDALGGDNTDEYISDDDKIAYNIGRMIGSLASIASGIAEVGGGGTVAAGGVAASSTGVGAVVGVPAAVGGGVVALHGAGVVSTATTDLAESTATLKNLYTKKTNVNKKNQSSSTSSNDRLKKEAEAAKEKAAASKARTQKREDASKKGNTGGNSNQETAGSHASGKSNVKRNKHENANARRAKEQQKAKENKR